MALTVSKHLASSMRAWMLTIAGRPWSGVRVATSHLPGSAYLRNDDDGTTTPESRMNHDRLVRHGFETSGRGRFPGETCPNNPSQQSASRQLVLMMVDEALGVSSRSN